MRVYRRLTTNILVLVIVAAIINPWAIRPAFAATNLLTNPGFEEGWYYWNLIPELSIPNGWDFWWADSGTALLDPQDHSWARPEVVTWLNTGFGDDFQQAWAWRDGTHTLKVFGAWRPIWFRLNQDVSGLTSGASYKFTVPIRPETVLSWDPKVYSGETNAGEYRLIARSGGQTFETGWLDATSVPPGQWNLLQLTFQLPSSSVSVEVEVRGRWGLVNNAFYLDQLSLEQTGAVVAATAEPTDTPPTNTPVPTATIASSTSSSSGSSSSSSSSSSDSSSQTSSSQSSAPAPTNTPIPEVAPDPTNTPIPEVAPDPTNTPIPEVAQAPASSSTSAQYIVVQGDTLWRIARDHGVTMDAIATLNGITNYALVFTGTTLQIPVAGSTASSQSGTTTSSASTNSTTTTAAGSTTSSTNPSTTNDNASSYTVQRGDTLAIIGRKFGLSASVLATTNNLNNVNLIYVGQELTIPARSKFYTVRADDTLASIAAQFGVTMDVLVSANRLRNPNLIYRGQVLSIP